MARPCIVPDFSRKSVVHLLSAADGKISNFEETESSLGAGVRTKASASAAFVRTTFSANVISSTSKSSSAALHGGAAYAEDGSAISLVSSSLDGNSLSSDAVSLAVQSPKGSIYVNGQPSPVHDVSAGKTVDSSAPTLPTLTGQEPWLLQTQSVRAF
jgi:hypothetical protein